MNRLDFRASLTIGSYRRSKENGIDWEIDINGITHYMIRYPKPSGSSWVAYDMDIKEEFGFDDTRRELLESIISGLWFVDKNV